MKNHLPLSLLIAYMILLSSCETNNKLKPGIPVAQLMSVSDKPAQNATPSEIKAMAQMLEKIAPSTNIKMQLPEEFAEIEDVVLAVDTSGSMRESPPHVLRPEVLNGIKILVEGMINLKNLVVLDLEGKPIASWTNEINDEHGVPEEMLREVLSRVANYKRETTSIGVIELIKTTDRLRSEDFNDSEIRLILFGDEFSGRAENFLLNIENWKTGSGGETYPIDLIFYDPFYKRSDIDSLEEIDRVLRTNEKFELFGRYLAGVTGGYFLKFERK